MSPSRGPPIAAWPGDSVILVCLTIGQEVGATHRCLMWLIGNSARGQRGLVKSALVWIIYLIIRNKFDYLNDSAKRFSIRIVHSATVGNLGIEGRLNARKAAPEGGLS